jgi:serine/threonine protein kinase
MLFPLRAIMFHIGVATKHPQLPDPGQLSPPGIDFIRQCLSVDASRRPTAAELLEHPWIAEFRRQLGLEWVSLGTPTYTYSPRSINTDDDDVRACQEREQGKLDSQDQINGNGSLSIVGDLVPVSEEAEEEEQPPLEALES